MRHKKYNACTPLTSDPPEKSVAGRIVTFEIIGFAGGCFLRDIRYGLVHHVVTDDVGNAKIRFDLFLFEGLRGIKFTDGASMPRR